MDKATVELCEEIYEIYTHMQDTYLFHEGDLQITIATLAAGVLLSRQLQGRRKVGVGIKKRKREEQSA